MKDPTAPYGRTIKGAVRYRCSDPTGERKTVREMVLDAVSKNPGIMGREVVDLTGGNYGSVSAELRRLCDDEELEKKIAGDSKLYGGAYRYYIHGTAPKGGAPSWAPEERPCFTCGVGVAKERSFPTLDHYHEWRDGRAKCERCRAVPPPFLGALEAIE